MAACLATIVGMFSSLGMLAGSVEVPALSIPDLQMGSSCPQLPHRSRQAHQGLLGP